MKNDTYIKYFLNQACPHFYQFSIETKLSNVIELKNSENWCSISLTVSK